jgi:spermidine/putrescine transport system permease protein
MVALSFAQWTGARSSGASTPATTPASSPTRRCWGALANSLEITLVVTVISVVLAYPLAAIIAFRVPARWQRLALLLAVLPFWTSYVVRSYSWLLVLGQNGVVNKALTGPWA